MTPTSSLTFWLQPGMPLRSQMVALDAFIVSTGLAPVSLRLTPGATAPDAVLELWLETPQVERLVETWSARGVTEDPGGRWVQLGPIRVWRGRP